MSQKAKHAWGVAGLLLIVTGLAGLAALALANGSPEKCSNPRPIKKIDLDLKKLHDDLRVTQDSLDRIQSNPVLPADK